MKNNASLDASDSAQSDRRLYNQAVVTSWHTHFFHYLGR